MPIVECPSKTAAAVTMSNLSNRLRRKLKQTGDLRRGHAIRKPQHRQRTQRYPDLLNPSTQQFAQVSLVFRWNLDSEGRARHTLSMP